MEEKVVYEVKLSKPVMAIASVAALSLLLIALWPVLDTSPTKVVICNKTGSDCAYVDMGQLIVTD